MPQQTVQDSWLSARWDALLQERCRAAVETAALEWPDTRSVHLTFNEIDRYDPELASELLVKPSHALRVGASMLNQIDVPVEPRPMFHLRVTGLPDGERFDLGDLRPEHLGRFLAIEGMIRTATGVYAMVREALWECKRCTTRVRLLQEDEVTVDPSHCDVCEAQTPWRFVEEGSSWAAYQKLEIQEAPEGVRSGQPQRILTHLTDDLVREANPGDRVRVNGILCTQKRRRGNQTCVEFDMVLNAVSLEIQEASYETVQITPELEEQICDLAAHPRREALFMDSFAPNVVGEDLIKEAMMLSLFGGVALERMDGTRVRGDIHLLMVGDPGVAKSQLLRYVVRLAPRAVYASGKGATAAGLTAGAVKDPLNEGRWTLEAGALVQADLGTACVDELDKMEKTDLSSMHEALEQQTITRSVAGLSATLRSRCNLIGAANPKSGRFDPFDPINAQVTIPPALLSRFDLIFTILDKPNRERDEEVAEKILNGLFTESLIAQRRASRTDDRMASAFPDMDVEDLAKQRVAPIDPILFRAYLAYARRHVMPVVPPSVYKRMKDQYIALRCQGDDAPVAITKRHLESLMRLAQASARWRLSQEATMEDAERAIRVQMGSMQSVGFDAKTGHFDVDRIAAPLSRSQHDRMKLVLRIVDDLARASSRNHADEQDVLAEAEREGLTVEECRKGLAEGKRAGTLFWRHGAGTWDVTGR